MKLSLSERIRNRRHEDVENEIRCQLEVEEVRLSDAGGGLVLYGGGSEAADPTHANALGGSYADHHNPGDDSVRFLLIA